MFEDLDVFSTDETCWYHGGVLGSGFCARPPSHQGSGPSLGSVFRTRSPNRVQPSTGNNEVVSFRETSVKHFFHPFLVDACLSPVPQESLGVEKMFRSFF